MKTAATPMDDMDDLLARAAPKQKFFEVILESQDIFCFTYPADHGELRAMKAQAAEHAKDWLAEKVPADWKPFLVNDFGTLTYVSLFAYRCVKVKLFMGTEGEGEEAKAKYRARESFGHLDFLKMAKRWAYGFESLKVQFDLCLGVAAVAYDIESIEDAKKDCAPTP